MKVEEGLEQESKAGEGTGGEKGEKEEKDGGGKIRGSTRM